MSTPALGALLAEGKAKKIYETDDPTRLVFFFKDDATAFNGQKKASLEDKGVLNQRIARRFFTLLKDAGIANHYVDTLSEREMLVEKPAQAFGEARGRAARATHRRVLLQERRTRRPDD